MPVRIPPQAEKTNNIKRLKRIFFTSKFFTKSLHCWHSISLNALKAFLTESHCSTWTGNGQCSVNLKSKWEQSNYFRQKSTLCRTFSSSSFSHNFLVYLHLLVTVVIAAIFVASDFLFRYTRNRYTRCFFYTLWSVLDSEGKKVWKVRFLYIVVVSLLDRNI